MRRLLAGAVVALAIALLVASRLGGGGSSDPDDTPLASVGTTEAPDDEPDDIPPDEVGTTGAPDDDSDDTPPDEVGTTGALDDDIDSEDEVSLPALANALFEHQPRSRVMAREDVLGRSHDNIIAIGSPLPLISRSYSALVADFNGDGLDDIQLSRHHSLRYAPLDVDGVWLADGAGGYALSQQLVPFNDRHACDAADVNGDGALDLYCTLGVSRGTKVKANELWLNRGDGTFDDVAVEWGVDDPFGRGREALFFDYDNDGDDDLYLLNTYGRSDERRSINILFANEGDRFVEIDSAITGEHGFTCPAVFDWDDNGWLDIMMCRGGRPVFFANEGGVFSVVTEDVLEGGKGWQR